MSASADRNLLFGILAVQLDFVTRDQLIAGMNAWLLDKARPLGDILRDQGHLSADELQHLAALVEVHLRRHGDDPQRSLAALSSADVIRRGLAAVADPDVQASLGHVGSGRRSPRSTVDLPPGPTSRYEVLRHHARGGLGEVFVAQDTELHRPVALKEIREEHADDLDSRTRFVLEAEVTGGLEHPGVVPVYGLGTYADGRPFYAMRFIKGDNLQQAIRRFHGGPGGVAAGGPMGLTPRRFDSLDFRQILGRFVDVCNAVAYAHSRGVLHRDLKPGNVMLGAFGETLVVDWGLAKVIGRPPGGALTDGGEHTLRPHSGGESGATVIGKALGTPAYMSPEQAAGRLDQLGPATDVYSLGATLYEVLTGRPPFSDTDLDAVQKGLFPPPRQVNIAVPRPLEAVCLKAMAMRPADRYASALNLAGEVERWLADEPVIAWREPPGVRTWRWVRRHRTAVTAAGVVAAAGAVGLGLLAVERERARAAVAAEQAQTAQERDEKDLAWREAEAGQDAARRERDRAVAARTRTREALDAMTSSVTGETMRAQRGLSEDQRHFLQNVTKYYEEFAAEPGENREARERLAAAHVRLGLIRHRLGRAEPAAAEFGRAAELYERLAADFPGVPDYRRELARSRNNRGYSLRA